MILFCFTLMYMISIGNVYIANILYYLLLIRDILKTGRLRIKNNVYSKIFYILFIFWVTISTVSSINDYEFTFRSVVQYMFTLQCIVLILPIKLNEIKFEFWIYRFSIMLSILILTLYAYFSYTSPGILQDDLWGVSFIPGWPNNPPIPLLVGLWMSFKNNKHFLGKIIIYIALFITTSRIALLGGLVIAFYFILKRSLISYKYKFALVGVIAISLIGINYMIAKDPLFITKLTVSWDRIDIFKTTMSYLDLRPFSGFGGRTLDQLISVKSSFIPAKNWGHTHNWVLEILLRYGIIGTLLFSGYLLSIYVKIKNHDKKFMFLLMVGMALFQTYIRDFVFLFFLQYLSTDMSVVSKSDYDKNNKYD